MGMDKLNYPGHWPFMLIGSYNPPLVLISILVAVLAASTSLDIAGRIASARGRAYAVWMCGGAMSMGVGIWSMHFIGMLAFDLPIEVAFDLWLSPFSPRVWPCGWSASRACLGYS